jgi:SNF2 family DNA or RNA helicase
MARRGVVLAFLTRFKQICNHPAQWLGTGDYDGRESGKMTRLAGLCEDISQRQQKALVFTQFREMTRPLAAHLERVFGRPGLTLDGQTPVKKRKGLVDTFQQEQGPPFMVISLKAGGTGLNLTAASHVIHFDRWWNPAVEDQATDRAHRIGQTRAVLVHKLICRGTVEERIDALIESKQAMARDLLGGGGEAVLTELSDQQLLGLVKLDLRAALEDE